MDLLSTQPVQWSDHHKYKAQERGQRGLQERNACRSYVLWYVKSHTGPPDRDTRWLIPPVLAYTQVDVGGLMRPVTGIVCQLEASL